MMTGIRSQPIEVFLYLIWIDKLKKLRLGLLYLNLEEQQEVSGLITKSFCQFPIFFVF